MRRYIYIGCVVFLLSLGLFSSVGLQNLDVNVYLLSLIIVLFLIFLRCAPSKNPKFYHAAQCIVLANITAYISFKLYFGGPYTLLFAKHISFTMPLLILVILFISSLFVLPLIRQLVDFINLVHELICKYFKKNSDRECDSVALFDEHDKDKEHLRNLMQYFDIVGVSGAWGSGKSYVVDSFCNDSHDDYYVININVLAYKYGEADKVLVEKLDDIFSENRIISASSAEMKELLGHSFLNTISYALMKSLGIGNTSSSMYEALKSDINKLSKPVLVVFDDLERVKDADYVRLLLAMAGQLASHNFKVIFEYDINGLEQLKIPSAYREKFLPVEMRITKVSYQSMAKQYWEELKMDEVKVKYLEDGTSSILLLKSALLGLESTIFSSGPYPCFEYNREVNGDQNYYQRFFVPFMTARNIRKFFMAVKLFFTSHKDTEFTPTEFHVVIAFYFMKYVRPNWYERMTANFLLEDMPLFEINGKIVSFREIAQNYKDYSSSSENSASIVKAQCIMSMFQYNYRDDKKNLGEKETQAESNHMIWYLLEGGQKPFTRLRETLNHFKEIVQNDNKQEQNDIKDKSVNGTNKFNKFEKWLNDPKYLNSYPELMNQGMIDISYALFVYNESEKLWETFLDFYQKSVYSHSIGDMMYQVLYFAMKANHPHTFIKIFDIFIKGTCKAPLPVVNLLYLQFLGESLSIIVEDYVYFDFFKSTPETKESVNKLIKQIKRTTDYKTLKQPLADLRASLVKASDTSQNADKKVQMERTVQFIDKNLELIDQFLNGN